MPTYQYACTACGHRFEAVQAFTDDSLTSCPECGGQLRKVYGSVGVVFKGSGFYRTDSRAASTTTAPAGEGGKAGDKTGDQTGGDKTGGDKKVAATADSAGSSKPAAAAAAGSSSAKASSGSGSGSSGGSSSGSKAAAG